jgi:hypothetical protein
MKTEDMDMEMADYYEDSADDYEDSAGSYLQVATVTNSQPSSKTIEPKYVDDLASANVTLVSGSNTTNSIWTKVKECKPEDVIFWCDFEILLGIIMF